MSAILSYLLGPTGRYLALAVLLSAVTYGIYWVGYRSGASATEQRLQAETLARVREAQASAAELRQRLADSESIAEDELRVAQQNSRAVTREVVRYVARTPNLSECGLDADGLRLWASANSGTGFATGPAGGVNAGVPGAAAAGKRAHE